MTQQGAKELYDWLSVAWMLVVKPNATEEWKTKKIRELYQTYRDYSDADVLEAFRKWTEENEKFPTTKNIINELKWIRVQRQPKTDPAKRYQMERIYDDGNEYVVMHDGKILFTWDEFLNLPGNPEHLDPEEWARRFEARRKQVLKKLYGGTI